MPVTQTQEEKYINGIKCDKENETAFFNDETHSYYNKKNMKTYISCTTIVHEYCQPFNADFWSSYKSMEKLLDPEDWSGLKPLLLNTKQWRDKYLEVYNIPIDLFLTTKNDILAEYKRKSEEACTKGTEVHMKKEMSFYNRSDFNFKKYGFSDLCGSFDCKENYYNLDLENGVYPEFLIQWQSEDGELMLAGISDLVIVHGKELYIIDWKTSKSIDMKGYYNRATKKTDKMKFPLNNLDDCNGNTYALQMSLYA